VTSIHHCGSKGTCTPTCAEHYTVDAKEKNTMQIRAWLRQKTLGERWHTNLLIHKMTHKWNDRQLSITKCI